ncbi:MAG: aldehyde dehydrogenase family protein [Patescibacteria group bacterium]
MTTPEVLGIGVLNSGVYAGEWIESRGKGLLASVDPATEGLVGIVCEAGLDEYEQTIQVAAQTFLRWRMVPAPKRGDLIRMLGDELRAHKAELGRLVTLETGKILAEGEGEVQEMIDACDFAVGLSRQLYGHTTHSERPRHRMYEQWQPLGVVGIITAFNFPVAVWAWNAVLAAVCGNTMIWKPSGETPITALAVQHLCNRACARFGMDGIFNLLVSSDTLIGEKMASDRRIALVSATGSSRMGQSVGMAVSSRLGRSLLELGGNNAVVVMPSANLALAIRAVVFGSVGTAGQRCTTTRRLIMHRSIADELTERVRSAYGQVKIGDPLDSRTLMGPLINEKAVVQMRGALGELVTRGAEVIYGGNTVYRRPGFFVEPTVVRASPTEPLVAEETFAPILYLLEVNGLEEGVALNNAVSYGLSSALFTDSVRESEYFLSHLGSDCGIANINIGTSGAEIGGAFGGEKDTGGGREMGSDSWKAYMRRQTCTINWSDELPLAQGIQFGS